MNTTAETLALTEYNRSAQRISSVDILRGIIMVVMALDHTRDFFSAFKGNPLDFHQASIFLYFTRWITHFCAPVFVFLSGASAYLSMKRGKTKREISWMLFSRGVWLVLLELTVIKMGWSFSFNFHFEIVQVIWAIGWSMIVLSALVRLPLKFIALFGFILIFGHNLLDKVSTNDFAYPGLWNILHQPGRLNISDGYSFFVIYPLIPWIGVMAVGYCFGSILVLEPKRRDAVLFRSGISIVLFFIALRWTNYYGDPRQWHIQGSPINTILDFLNCQKYPPSLLYLCMTLGPAIAIMPILEKMNNSISGFFTVYGRVPMFYYILHIYLIHTMALITGLILRFPTEIFRDPFTIQNSTGWGFSLPIVYLYWISAVLILYLPCKWYMNYKMKSKKWWLSYV
jgi:uncharacterized membrane protein